MTSQLSKNITSVLSFLSYWVSFLEQEFPKWGAWLHSKGFVTCFYQSKLRYV